MRRSWVVLVALVLTACLSGGQQSLREGLLRPDIGQKAFRTEWGEPDQIIPVLSETTVAERWGQPADILKRAEGLGAGLASGPDGRHRADPAAPATPLHA